MNFISKRLPIVFFLLSLSNFTFSQRKFFIKITGENNSIVNTVDSLSFKGGNRGSQFYVDSLTKKPYSGLAIIDYNGNYLDSLSIKNGYESGISKKYYTKGKVQLDYIRYADNDKNIYISRTFKIFWDKGSSKNKFCSIWITIPEGNNAFSFKLIQHEDYLQLTSSSLRKKIKRKIANKAELLNFMSDFNKGEEVYLIAEKIGIFEGLK